jgi:hypothetical protein
MNDEASFPRASYTGDIAVFGVGGRRRVPMKPSVITLAQAIFIEGRLLND